MIRLTFRFIVGIVIAYFVFILIYLFLFFPYEVREPIGDRYPIGAYVLVSKISRFGNLDEGDIVLFKSMENLDVDKAGIIEKVSNNQYFIENISMPVGKNDILGKIMFCYFGCK